MILSDIPRISPATIAAFLPLSIPTVPTGTPGGILAMVRSASCPSSFLEHGTPMTGFSVRATTDPATRADNPLIAMNNFALLI